MAGDYLPIRLDLPDDPAVIQMAAALGISEDDVVGRLVRTWAWFNRHSADGHAPGVTPAWLDRYTSTDGWSRAMAAAGWLEISDSGLTIPGYDTWNDEAAKKRLKERDRKRTQREKPGVSRTRRDNTGTSVPSVSQTCPAKSWTNKGLHNSTDTDTGQDRGTDHIRTSWKNEDYQLQIRSVAAEHFRGGPFLEPHEYREEDRRDLLALAAIHHSGQVRPAWFLGGVDAIRNRTDPKPVTAPVRLLKRILADKWPAEAEKRFGAFYKLVYAIGQEIPAELLTITRRPAEAATTTT